MEFFKKKENLIIKNRLWKFIKLKNNNLIIGKFPKFQKSQIKIKGSNNILYCDGKVLLNNSTVRFNGDNSLIFLGAGTYTANITVYNNSTVYIGKHNYFNPHGDKSKIILSEGKNLFIGDKCAFSFGLFFRTADPHLIYDTSTHKRINNSKSIYIGDHVWIGQNVTILKGSNIHSGSIIGTESIVSNKKINSNEIWGGIPAKKLKDNIFWTGKCVHAWTEKDTEENTYYLEDDYIYTPEPSTISFETIENTLNSYKSANDKYLYLKNLTTDKNRFASQSN